MAREGDEVEQKQKEHYTPLSIATCEKISNVDQISCVWFSFYFGFFVFLIR